MAKLPIRDSLLFVSAATLFAALPVDATVHAETEKVEPCYSADASIRQVLDSCAEVIASGEKDEQRLLTAYLNRAMGLSATGGLDAAMKSWTRPSPSMSKAPMRSF